MWCFQEYPPVPGAGVTQFLPSPHDTPSGQERSEPVSSWVPHGWNEAPSPHLSLSRSHLPDSWKIVLEEQRGRKTLMMVVANGTHTSYRFLQPTRVERGHLQKSLDGWGGSLHLSRCLKHQTSSLKKSNLRAVHKCIAKKLNSERRPQR